MLTAITWPQFLIFLFCLVGFYYLAFVTIHYSVKMTRLLKEKKRTPQVIPFPAVDLSNDLREPLKAVPEPSGLVHEIRLHLQQITPYDFTRDETILSVKKVIQTYAQDKLNMGKEAFMEQIKRAFYIMCSISLTPGEVNELWEVQAS